MDRPIIDEKANTLIECRRHVMWERIDYLIIPHYHNGIRIDHIAPSCSEYVSINLLCIEEGVKYLNDGTSENASVFTMKLPQGIKIGEHCFANSTLTEILLPRDLHIIKKETFLNCRNLETISAELGINTIAENAFKGYKNLKEAHFRIVKFLKITFSTRLLFWYLFNLNKTGPPKWRSIHMILLITSMQNYTKNWYHQTYTLSSKPKIFVS